MICEGRHPSFPLQGYSKTEEEEAKQAEVSKAYSCEDVGLIQINCETTGLRQKNTVLCSHSLGSLWQTGTEVQPGFPFAYVNKPT